MVPQTSLLGLNLGFLHIHTYASAPTPTSHRPPHLLPKKIKTRTYRLLVPLGITTNTMTKNPIFNQVETELNMAICRVGREEMGGVVGVVFDAGFVLASSWTLLVEFERGVSVAW